MLGPEGPSAFVQLAIPKHAQQIGRDVRRRERRNFALVVRGSDLDDVRANEIHGLEAANDLKCLRGGQSARDRSSGSRSVGGIATINVEREVRRACGHAFDDAL
jgi:hypothetical protein